MHQERKELRDIDDKDITAKFIGISLVKTCYICFRRMQRSLKEVAVKRNKYKPKKRTQCGFAFHCYPQ